MKCLTCGKDFMADWWKVNVLKQGKTCSRKCGQENRHKAYRDAKWAEDMQKRYKESD